MPEESPKPGGEVILFQTEDAQTRLQVRLDGQTAWLTQAQMAELFQTTPQNITCLLYTSDAAGISAHTRRVRKNIKTKK